MGSKLAGKVEGFECGKRLGMHRGRGAMEMECRMFFTARLLKVSAKREGLVTHQIWLAVLQAKCECLEEVGCGKGEGRTNGLQVVAVGSNSRCC